MRVFASRSPFARQSRACSAGGMCVRLFTRRRDRGDATSYKSVFSRRFKGARLARAAQLDEMI